MEKKYALHGGYVRSKIDGDEHYVSARQLVGLYELRMSECLVVEDERGSEPRLAWPQGLAHLYPRYDGNYGRPKNIIVND